MGIHHLRHPLADQGAAILPVRRLAVLLLLASAPAGCRNGPVSAQPPSASSPVQAVTFDRDVLVVRLPHGASESIRVPVLGPHATQARLALRTVTHRELQVRVLPPDAHSGGGAIAVDVTASSAVGCLPVGVHVGNIVLETGLSELPTLTLPYSIRVSGTLEVSPTNPYFNLRDPGAHARTIIVRSTAPDGAAFQVLAADVVSGPFAATVEKAGPGVFHLHVHVLVRARDPDVPDDERGLLGRLIIRSTDATEPTKEIPLFAFGPLGVTPLPAPADGGK